LRKKFLKKGVKLHKHIDEKTNQVCSAVDEKDVDKIKPNIDGKTCCFENVFYIIQLFPEISPNRIKLGFTSNIEQRKRNYITICPTMKVIKTWKCSAEWEQAVIAQSITGDCKKVGQEVFDIPSIENFVSRLNKIFSLFKE
jgi:hypothetical protein